MTNISLDHPLLRPQRPYLKESEKYILNEYLKTSSLESGDWSRAISVLKNANEELTQRASFLTDYRIMLALIVGIFLGIGALTKFLSINLSLEEITIFAGALAFVGSVVGVTAIAEKIKNQEVISLHNQAINILDHLSKKHPE